MYPLDIKKQIDRTFENIEALLSEAEANMCNVMQYIVYLRDTADYAIVNNYIQAHYPNIPHVIVLAPVCRPGWLIEIECIAIKSLKNNEFAAF
jgi:enamine deaminase RidA (YjgF/YER057c/UK114 family)